MAVAYPCLKCGETIISEPHLGWTHGEEALDRDHEAVPDVKKAEQIAADAERRRSEVSREGL